MKVLIIHPQMKYFGGAELLIVELCNGLTKKGIKNDILTLSKSKEVQRYLLKTRIIVPKNNVKINSGGFESIVDLLKGIKILRKAVNKIYKDYDIINFHNYPSTWTLFPRKKSCVWMLNEPPNLWSKPNASFMLKALNKIRNFIDKFIVRNSVDIICVADDFNKQRTLQRYGKESEIVYYGVNYNFFSKGNIKRAFDKWNLKGRFTIIQSGVLTKQKNQLESIKTIEKVRKSIPNILLILAGKEADEEYCKRIKKYIQEKKLEKNILITGNLSREDLRDLYKASNVGLFPVGQQGGWLAPFEMLCSGNPIIVSEEMGAASIVKKFSLGISTKNYSEALLKVFNDYKNYKKKASNSAKFVNKNLGWNVFTDKIIKAYKKVLKMH